MQEMQPRQLKKSILLAALFVVLVGIGFLISAEGDRSSIFGFKLQFRITNATGQEVAVTSAHTHETTVIPGRASALIPHLQGDITIDTHDGPTWLYKSVSRTDLEGTPYAVMKKYPVPFGGGVSTVNLLLAEDGRLHVVLPDTKDVVGAIPRQPDGFPLDPEEL